MKNVKFNPSVSIRRHSISASDDSWLTDKDYAKILRSVKKMVRSIREDSAIDDNIGLGLTSRGIEHLRSTEHLEQQIINKDCAISVVLSEQRRLADEGIATADAAVVISEAYQQHTRWARQNALLLAASDEAFMRSNVKMTTGTCTASSPTPADAQSPDPSSGNKSNETNAAYSLDQLSSLTIDNSDGVAIQPHSQQQQLPSSRSAGRIHAPSRVSPLRTPNSAESTPNTWLNHHDSLQLPGVKNKNSRSNTENQRCMQR
jgi:hypothetical protein